MFKITEGKGFHMTFANGWTVSVQWGSGNYCPNYSVRPSEWTTSAYGEMQRKLGEVGSPVAEAGWWKGRLVNHSCPADGTHGWGHGLGR